MRGPRKLSWVVTCLLLIWHSVVYASSPPDLAVPSGLSFAEIKITGDEYILLQNNTGSDISASELSSYWVYAFNSSNPLASGVSSSSQQLPEASLAAGQTFLLSSTGGSTCGSAGTDKLSLSLTDGSGYLEVVHQTMVAGVLTTSAGDAVSWTSASSPTAGAQIVTPTSSSAKTSYASYRYQEDDSPLTYWWQPASVDSLDACQLNVTGYSDTVSKSSVSLLTPSSPPPARIVSLAGYGGDATGMSASDVGLRSPQICELLPNPAPPTKDSEGEFVELYNSNPVSFDLANFVLETGIATKHKYTFPTSVLLKPKSFTAFKLGGTGLSLSNTSGQVELLDPFGKVISRSDVYSGAKDGQAWAEAGGKWYWTSTPTPSAENVITQNGVAVKASSGPQILSAATKPSSGPATGTSSVAEAPAVTPVHPWTLAGVGTAALLYAGYEYRADLANNLYRIRRYQASRRTVGK